MGTNQRIEIHTIFGTLFAEAGGDPTYPSIQVCIETADKDSSESRELQLVTIEATPKDVSLDGNISTIAEHDLRVLVWANQEEDSYTHAHNILTKSLGDVAVTNHPETRCGNCFRYITGNCDEAVTPDNSDVCTVYDALPTVENRNDFTAPDVIAELRNQAFNQLVENALQYVSVQGHSDSKDDYGTLKALLGNVVNEREIAAYVAFLHN